MVSLTKLHRNSFATADIFWFIFLKIFISTINLKCLLHQKHFQRRNENCDHQSEETNTFYLVTEKRKYNSLPNRTKCSPESLIWHFGCLWGSKPRSGKRTSSWCSWLFSPRPPLLLVLPSLQKNMALRSWLLSPPGMWSPQTVHNPSGLEVIFEIKSKWTCRMQVFT